MARLFVGLWMLGDGTKAGDEHALAYVRRLYDTSGGRYRLDDPRPLTVPTIVAEIDELVAG